MKQVFQSYRDGEIFVADVPVSKPGQGQILVRNRASLISVGTERAMIEVAKKSLLGKARARPDWVRQVVDKIRTEGLGEAYRQSLARLDMPVPLGYSSAGVVVEVGREVTEFKIGERVACSGSGFAGHAEIITVPRNLCTPIPDPLSFEEASFVALGGIALEAVRLARTEIGHRVAVIGLGLIGQLAVQILKAGGCRVIGVDLVAEKIELARNLGADFVIDGATDPLPAVLAATDGQGADSVIIMAGSPDSGPLEQAAAMCRERGRVIATGLVDLTIPRQAFYEKEIEFVVSRAWGPGLYDVDYTERDVIYPLPYVRWTARRNMEVFLDLTASGQIDLASLITHRIPFDDVLDGYRMILESREPSIGVVLGYGDEPVPFTRRLDFAVPSRAATASVGVGLIGAGLFARGTLLPALRKVPGAELIALAELSGADGQHLSKKYDFAYTTTDHTALLDDDRIKLVFVLTRHNAHAGLVVEVLQAGKAVYVEKPLALSRTELLNVFRAWRDSSGFLMVGFNRRFAPATRFLQARLGYRSDPAIVTVRCNAGSLPADSWVHDPQSGGGRIVGEACHFVDLIQALTGSPPRDVVARATTGSHADLQDDFIATMSLAEGSVGSIAYAAGGDASFPREYAEVIGNGTIGTIRNFRSATWTEGGRTRRRRWRGADRGHRGELAVLLEHLTEGRSQPVAMEEYLATTLATFAIRDSLVSGEPIPVDLDGFLAEAAGDDTP